MIPLSILGHMAVILPSRARRSFNSFATDVRWQSSHSLTTIHLLAGYNLCLSFRQSSVSLIYELFHRIMLERQVFSNFHGQHSDVNAQLVAAAKSQAQSGSSGAQNGQQGQHERRKATTQTRWDIIAERLIVLCSSLFLQ